MLMRLRRAGRRVPAPSAVAGKEKPSPTNTHLEDTDDTPTRLRDTVIISPHDTRDQLACRNSELSLQIETTGAAGLSPRYEKREARSVCSLSTIAATPSSWTGGSYPVSENGSRLSISAKSTKSSIVLGKSPSTLSLSSQLCDARVESPPHSFRYFYPEDVFRQIMHLDSIRFELQKAHYRFADEKSAAQAAERIAESAPKLFATLLWLERGHLISEFLDENIDDSHLPFVRSDIRGSVKFCSGKPPNDPIQCMKTWEQKALTEFGKEQMSTQAPIFEFGNGIEHYELDENCVLPWKEKDERHAEGGSGSVRKIVIHPGHQRVLGAPPSEVRMCPFATCPITE